MLVLLPVAGLTGCATSASDDGADVVDEVRQQIVTAETIAGLKAGEQLVLDMKDQRTSYTFDFSKAPIDFSRITLLHTNGDAQRMDQWLNATRDHGRALLAAPDRAFRLAPSPQGFADLSSTEVSQLESTGNLVTKSRIKSNQSETRSALGCTYTYYLQCTRRPPYVDVWDCVEIEMIECDGEP